MRHTNVLSTLFLFAAGLWALPSVLRADDNVQRRSNMTVAEPTEIPGYVLQPGIYLVKVMDYKDEKEIVQFSNPEDTKVVATVLAIRDRRVRTDDGQTGFIYFQRSPGSSMALKSWYYAGDEWGEVFVYPRSKAVVLASVTHEEVAATPAESNPPTLQAEVTVIKPEESRKPVVVAAVAPEVKTAAEPAPPVVVAEKTPVSLPKTGSDLPLVGLIGLGALAGAAGLHLVRRIV